MTEDDARQLLRVGIEASSVLGLAVSDLNGRLSEDDARSVRRGVGHVLAEIDERLFELAFVAHPQLRPANTVAAWEQLAEMVGVQKRS